MRCIKSHSTDPYFNLAAEEYLVKQVGYEYYFQYVNMPSVVIGKHQNAVAEINIDFLNAKGIMLARRISGGGAVYHDEGNLNFSFITNESPGDFIKFSKYTAPIIAGLNELGVGASLGKRNEILAGDRKISGTASHVFKNRVLHHGTLLYNTNLEKLGRCLYVNQEAYQDKAVRSVRSEVANIKDFLSEELSFEDFSDFIYAYILNSGPENVPGHFNEGDISGIEQLWKEKFSRWKWNYAYSPKYVVDRTMDFEGKPVHFRTTVVKGLISKIEIEGNPGIDVPLLDHLIIGADHNKYMLQEILKSYGIDYVLVRKILDGLF